jgi:hypothetical protein
MVTLVEKSRQLMYKPRKAAYIIHQHELKTEDVRAYTLKAIAECDHPEATGADPGQLANSNMVIVSMSSAVIAYCALCMPPLLATCLTLPPA